MACMFIDLASDLVKRKILIRGGNYGFIKFDFEKHNKLLADSKLLPIRKACESYRTFQENFGPDTLKSLDGEVLLKPF